MNSATDSKKKSITIDDPSGVKDTVPKVKNRGTSVWRAPGYRTSLCWSAEGTSEEDDTTNPFKVYNERIIIGMVGLPARGKSFISHAIVRYMNFLGCPAKIFNAGVLRRERGLAGTDASFFDAKNTDAAAQRETLAMDTLEMLLTWLKKKTTCEKSGNALGSAVAIFDATNTTVVRRKAVMDRCLEEARSDPGIKLMFVESIADDEELLQQNYRMKLHNDDYKGKNAQAGLDDFLARVKQYEAVYEPICDELDGESTRYIKLINAGKKIVSNGIDGYTMRKVESLVGSMHIGQRTIYLALVGQTTNELKGILGGDSLLTEAGEEYAREMGNVIADREFMNEYPSTDPMFVMTGTLRRYKEHVYLLGFEKPMVRTLASANELCSGDLDSLTFDEMEERYPEEVKARAADKLNYRYPGVGGESYHDLVERVQYIVTQLEQSRGNFVVICDRAMFRTLEAYFRGKTIQELPYLDVKPGVLELRRNAQGFSVTHLSVDRGAATAAVGPGGWSYDT